MVLIVVKTAPSGGRDSSQVTGLPLMVPSALELAGLATALEVPAIGLAAAAGVLVFVLAVLAVDFAAVDVPLEQAERQVVANATAATPSFCLVLMLLPLLVYRR
jgi:hypothetical protein